MLLYLTSAENVGLFDFLTEELGMLVKKLSGEFSLNKFVVHDMRNLSHFSYIAIDLEAIKDSPDRTIESLIAFKALYDSRIIIFAEKAPIDLLNRIIEEVEIYNIITAKDIEKIKEEIKISVSSQGMKRDYLIRAMNNSMDINLEAGPQYSFIGENVKIIVGGTMNRVGTTTTSLNMASYLSSIGAKVSYTEANGSNHLEKVHSCLFSNIPIKDDAFSIEGFNCFFNNNIPANTDYNFNIIDIGVLGDKNYKVLNIADLVVLVGGVRPYEIDNLKTALQLINKQTRVLLPIEDKLKIKNINIPIDKFVIDYIKYSSNLFEASINNEVWKDLLSDYIVEHKTL